MRRRKFFKLLAGLPFVGAAVCKGLALARKPLEHVCSVKLGACRMDPDAEVYVKVYTGFDGEPGGRVLDLVEDEPVDLEPGERVVCAEIYGPDLDPENVTVTIGDEDSNYLDPYENLYKKQTSESQHSIVNNLETPRVKPPEKGRKIKYE